jgi:hypothetical protein
MECCCNCFLYPESVLERNQLIQRRVVKCAADGSVTSEYYDDVSWVVLRRLRDAELSDTDHWALSDRTMSDEMGSYRVMLRDLPSDFEGENANQACDHWVDNPRPED